MVALNYHRGAQSWLPIVVIVTVGLLPGCNDDDDPVPAIPDQYAVYASLLPQALRAGWPPKGPYVIQAETDFPDYLRHPNNIAYLKSHFPADSTVVDSLITMNLNPERVDETLFHLNVTLIEREEVLEIVRTSPTWEEFERRYPGSRVALAVSRVSFDPQHSTALVYWHYICGGLCGAGFMTQMNLVDGQWLLVKTLGLWIS